MTETANSQAETLEERPPARKGACAAVFIDVECESGVECEKGLCILRIRGRFATGADLDYLTGKLEQIWRLRSRRILADLTELVSIGSTGLSFLISLHRIATSEPGGKLMLAGSNPLVRETLHLTGIYKIIPRARDVATGTRALLD